MLLIFDGNNLAHRCRHAYNLSNRGMDTSVTFGSLSIIASTIRKFKAKSVIVCWDGGIPEYRRKKLPEYKATRTRGDPDEYADFIRQVKELDAILPMMGIVSVRKRGAEADDLMYHASRLSDTPCTIITTDNDLLQAVTAGVDVYSPTKDKLFQPKHIKRKYGVTPATLVHMKALMGDSSDNIRGVKGIGEKTAIKLFEQFGSLSAIMNAALDVNPNGSIGGKLGDNILDFGMDRLIANASVISLAFDRVGAKCAIVDAVDDYTLTDKRAVKRYLMRNAFASLVSGQFISTISKLVQPKLCLYGARIPIVCSCRERL